MSQVLFLVTFLGLTACSPIENIYLPSNTSPSTPVGLKQQSGADEVVGTTTSKKKPIPIVKYLLENDGEGTYSYNYEGANGITSEEKGEATSDGTKAHGSYSFALPNGEHVSVTYTANENGFVAQGSHIPKVPDAILKALEENAAAEARGVFDDGQYHGEGLEDAQYKGEGENAGSNGIITTKAETHGSNGGYLY